MTRSTIGAADCAKVAAVCGNEMRIYGKANTHGVRPFIRSMIFPSHGAAKQAADDFDTRQKAGTPRK